MIHPLPQSSTGIFACSLSSVSVCSSTGTLAPYVPTPSVLTIMHELVIQKQGKFFLKFYTDDGRKFLVPIELQHDK
jgi:hypothetical protein